MATLSEVEKMRPNIRIEIPNNLKESEQMDVDPENDNEEGEIIEPDDIPIDNTNHTNHTSQILNRVITNNEITSFTTGINIFDKQEQEKLQERAKRFALKPEEIHNFTDADLAELYESLGITSDNEADVRFDAVHMLGITGLTTEDVLDYFAKYAPKTIEWINNDSCNVTWIENITAARAMFYSSKAVRGMPAREPENVFAKDFLDDIDEQEATGKSILLKNREVELKIDSIMPNKVIFKNSVDISEITIPIPPGYWRLGEKHPKAKCILLRYSLKTDQTAYMTENFSKYYKKMGSGKSIIPDYKKNELKGIFERNKELSQEKNPWGSLAKNWNQDAKFREPERGINPQIEIKNPSLLVRLGKKKEIQQESEEDVEVVDNNKPKSSRVPRMRMYADEEEEKVRRKKLIQTLKKHTDSLMRNSDISRTKDLRNVLRLNNKVPADEVIVIDNDSDELDSDLGSRLRNRTRNMVFAVERNSEEDFYERKENRSDARNILDHRRAQSPLSGFSRKRTHSANRRFRSRSPIKRYRSPVRKPSRTRSYNYEKNLHSDRMHLKHRYRKRRSEEKDSYAQKTRSRVTVVVRKPKKPTVPSTIWSRVQHSSETESSSDSESSEDESESSSSSSSSSEESESESESESGEESSKSDSSKDKRKKVGRPGFRGRSAAAVKVSHQKTPLKITMPNDRYSRVRR